MRNWNHEQPPKVHLYMDQHGAKIRHSQRLFANTMCKMNSDVPQSRITTDHNKVTCKICRKDARFRLGAPIAPAAPAESLTPLRTRHRRNWLGKLVLQVEYDYNNADPRDPGDIGQTFHRWRDATLADLNMGVV